MKRDAPARRDRVQWLCASRVRRRGAGRATAPEPAARRRIKLAFVTNNSADFWTIARRGVEKADAELADVEAEFRITADGTAAEQQRIVDDLLTKGVDGIAISPVDPQNQTALIDAAAKRALVFTQDSDAPQSARTCYIGTDNVAAGRQAGQLIREAIPEGGSIMLFVGKLDARNAQERMQGIKEALAGIEHPHHRRADRRCGRRAGEGERGRHAGAVSRHQGAGRAVELQRSRHPQRRARGRQGGPGPDRRVRRSRRDAGRRQGRRDSRDGRAAAVRVRLPGDHADGAGGARRPVVHPGVEADHRADAGREPRERRGVHAADQRTCGGDKWNRSRRRAVVVFSRAWAGPAPCSPTASWLDAIGYAQGGRGPARAFIQQPRARADFDRRVLGAFLEHLGRAIYTGVYQPGSRAGRREGLPHRRGARGQGAGRSDHPLSRRQLRLRATTGSTASVRRRSGRRCSSGRGTRSRRTSSAPTSSSTGAGWSAPSRCSA